MGIGKCAIRKRRVKKRREPVGEKKTKKVGFVLETKTKSVVGALLFILCEIHHSGWRQLPERMNLIMNL